MKRIKQISVKNLFGMFDHTISLNLDERITIMHGPNGFGKTAMLRLLNDIFNLESSTLQNIPFEEFRVYFEDGANFIINKTYKNETFNFSSIPPNITFHFFNFAQAEAIIAPLTTKEGSIVLLRLKKVYYSQSMRLDGDETEQINKNPLTELWKNLSLRFIETQRLENIRIIRTGESFENYEEEAVVEPTVVTYSQDITQTIEAKLAESTILAQSLDRTFPIRLANLPIKKYNITEEEIRSKLEMLENKRQYLTAVGLLNQESDESIQIQEYKEINEVIKVVLSVYAEDIEKKLGIFDELADKIDLLKRIINKRFLYKEMTISKDEGFVFTNSNGVVLSPNELSSGEQHELILFYELLFKVAPGSLILIDEPEISLHVVWQEQFLEDVQAVTRLSDIDVLLATHSPDIIAGRRDLMVELKGPM